MDKLNLKYEFTEQEVDYILQLFDQVQVKGLQAINYLMGIVAKFQNPVNKKEYDAAKAAQITEQITGIKNTVLTPEQMKKAIELLENMNKNKPEPPRPPEPKTKEHKQGG